MEKIVRSEDNEELVRQLGSLIEVVETDKMRKLASSNSMSREFLRSHKPDKDHFLLHVIGLGDYETYGFNRNADAFTKKANKSHHHTFVDNGHFFREHNNSDPSKKIGDVAASIHNDDMDRVELAVWGHKKKASDVYDRVKSGDNISVSMSCTVSHDVDSITGKKCKTPFEYEPHMRSRPGQYIPEHKKYAFVYNPHPNFFDISYVERPADRIAHYLDFILNENEGLSKAASENGTIPGAFLALADRVKVPDHIRVNGIQSSDKNRLLEKAAHHEALWTTHSEESVTGDIASFIKHAAQYTFDPEDQLSAKELSVLRELQPETLFHELGKRACVLPYYSFLAYALNSSVDEMRKDASAQLGCFYLPTVFKDLMEADDIPDESLFDGHNHSFMSRCDSRNTDVVQRLMDNLTERFSVAPGPSSERTVRISIIVDKDSKNNSKQEKDRERTDKEKKASSCQLDTARQYANLYGLYKLSALQQMEKSGNYILDNQLLMRVISQHNS